MATTKENIDGLTEAIASPERQVTLNGKSVTIRSIADLEKAREILKADQAAQLQKESGTKRKRQVRLFHAGRGY